MNQILVYSESQLLLVTVSIGSKTKCFHHSKNSVWVNNQEDIIYNINATRFWLVIQVNDLDQYLINSKCKITAKLAFVDISKADGHVIINSSVLLHSIMNKHQMDQRTNNSGKLTIKNHEMHFLHNIIANGHTFGFDAVMFIVSINSLEVTLTSVISIFPSENREVVYQFWVQKL